MYKSIEKKLGMKIEEIKILKSGWAGEIISLKSKDNGQKYIIKTYNSSKNALQNIKQEWDGLNLLYKAGYTVPKPINSDFISEKPYIVMEEIEGEDLWKCYINSPKEDKEQVLDEFVKVFLKLHELDISVIGMEHIKESTSYFIEKEINEIKGLVKENNLNYLSQVIQWLEKEKVNLSNHRLSIIHRDYHPWNIIIDKNKKLYVIDLLWGIGDYRFDLAWTCTLMERSGFEEFGNEVFKKYTRLKNKNIDNFEYFKVFSTLRWLVNVIISLKTNENLNETRREEFENFIHPLIKKGLDLIQEITLIKVEV